MSEYINPGIITWARERSGLTIDELARKLNKDPSLVQMWERGEKAPSYSNLEELAYKHLKLPVAVFYFPDPPEIEDPRSKFRRLPEYEFSRFSSDTLQAIRIAQGYQESLSELMPVGTSSKRIFYDIKVSGVNPGLLAQKVRSYLSFDLKRQFDFRSPEEAFKGLRHAIEEVGVFTFKDSLKDRFISGFSLIDKNFPVIFINNSSSFTRQLFTLAHELGHILWGVSGITDTDDTFIQVMSPREKALEINCNQFASELLVPESAFRLEILKFNKYGLTIIPEIAQKYSVSREVILRKLLSLNLVSQDYYDEMAEEWTKDYLRMHSKSAGGNYYLTKLSYLGEGFTRLALENFYRGQLTKAQLANHLNIKAKNIDTLVRYFGG